MQNNKRLNESEWGYLYNSSLVNSVCNDIIHRQFSVQTAEMFKLTKQGNSILEIGCGSGSTSLALSLDGRKCTALDNSPDVIDLVSQAASKLGTSLQTILYDAEKPLPYTEDYFDFSFQAGLLEHFYRDERVRLLKNWGIVSKKMVSLVPNAASLAYRYGKALMEKNGTWQYGLEIPLYSLINDFEAAGFRVTDEYTIGEMHSLNFLPKYHPLRLLLRYLFNKGIMEDNAGQGYLLVTVGEKK